MAFRASVEAEKWARKDEADYAVSHSHSRQTQQWHFFMYVRFEAMNYSDSALQLLTQYSPQQLVESTVESVLWQENGRVHWWRHIIISLICDLK